MCGNIGLLISVSLVVVSLRRIKNEKFFVYSVYIISGFYWFNCNDRKNKELSAFVMTIGCIYAAINGITSDDIIFAILCVALAVVSISGLVFGADKTFAVIGIYDLEIPYCRYCLSCNIGEADEVIKNGDWAIQVVTVAIMLLCGYYFVKADLRYSNIGDSIKRLLEEFFE